jgi:hypothetical protein
MTKSPQPSRVELPKVDCTQIQGLFKKIADVVRPQFEVYSRDRTGVESRFLCQTLADAEKAAYVAEQSGAFVSVFQWVARHKKYVERVAFWTYTVDADGCRAYAHPSMETAELVHNQNKIGHNYNTVGYTRRMVSQAEVSRELSERFGDVAVEY